MWITSIRNSASKRFRPRRSLVLPFAIALIALASACSSAGGSDNTPTPAGSGQIPVENPDGTGRPDSPLLTGDGRRGFDIYFSNGCSTCHSGIDISLGPSHAGIYDIAATRVEGLSAEQYIVQSLQDPDAFIVPGFDSPSTMPTFPELAADEIQFLIAYMKTLEGDVVAPTVVSAGGLPVGVPEEGRRLYGSIGCSGCHSLGSDRIVGPGFKGVGDRAKSRRPGLSADEYIVESIVDPRAFIVEGFPRQMPAFDELSTQQIADLLAFLKTVK